MVGGVCAGGANRSVPVGDMASVHLSISKHWQLSSLSTGGEVIPFFSLFSSASPCSQPLLVTPPPQPHPSHPASTSVPFCRSIYPPPSSTFYTLPSPLSLFLFSSIPASSPSAPSLHLPSPRLSMERPIQQQNKAAYSITRWLIKQDQNSAALRSTRQRYDTAPQRRGGGFSLVWRTGGRVGWRGSAENSDTDAGR